MKTIALFVLSGVMTAPLCAANWPQFRGIDHNYLSTATGLPMEWSGTENVQWQTPIPGGGWASPVVWGDKVFIATAIQEEAGKDTAPPPNYRSGRVGADSIYRWELHCLDLATGKTLWKQVAHRGNPRVRSHPQNTYASETPTTDGERIYVYYGMVGLFCYDMDGALVWKKDFGGYTMLGDWGTSSSPILHDGLLYLQIDNEENSFLTALDPPTGDEVWRVERGPGSSWSTPMIWRNAQREELITNSEDVRAYDPKTGQLFWSLTYPGGRASSSPLGTDDTLYVGNERRRDGGGVMYAIEPGASGDITLAPGETTNDSIRWSLTEGGPEFASPFIYEGLLYLFGRNRGTGGCYDPATGELLYGLDRLPRARPFWSSSWGYDGHVFCTDERGNTYVIKAGNTLQHVRTNTLGEAVRASPALVDGAIILRGEHHVFRIGN